MKAKKVLTIIIYPGVNNDDHKNNTTSSSRRKALKLAAGGGLVSGAAFTSGIWIKPMIKAKAL